MKVSVRVASVLFLLFLSLATFSQSTAAMHDTWDAILKKHVDKNGVVDYQGIAADSNFNRYIGMLQKVKGAGSYSRDNALAYWINVYNAFTVKLILDNWPVKSIKDIPNAWDQKFIQLPTGSYSLNQIENEVIRKEFNEPRIHFALVCAAVSCPKLHNRAITDVNLEATLEQLTKDFLNNKMHNDVKETSLMISEIFKWYASDFEPSGGIRAFTKKYTGINVNKVAAIDYKPYNWELNGVKKTTKNE